VRIGRNPVEDCYSSEDYKFEIGKAVTMREGNDITIIASGETVRIALDTAIALEQDGVHCRVINMHTIKPLDQEVILKAAAETGKIITMEEHSIFGGLGSAVAEVVIQHNPVPMTIIGIPDEPAITGVTAEIFEHYGISASNGRKVALEMIQKS
jgi:transketolase